MKCLAIAVAASHHRPAWIHPFRDGNGRVARLHTHLVLGKLGLTNGLWSPLRSFARTQDAYYARLSGANEPRAGAFGGRGDLSEKGLTDWLTYVLGVCADQVAFMEKMLALDGMRDRMASCALVCRNMHCGFTFRTCGPRQRLVRSSVVLAVLYAMNTVAAHARI